ncbi:MAG TPA: hypothetical protein VH419_05370 [Nocardioidaceae bacterium]
MDALGPAAVLDLWDHGGRLVPAERALMALSLAGIDAGERTVGERDAALLALHAATYGGSLAGVTDCPACGESLDVDVPTAHLAVDPPTAGARSIEIADDVLSFRLPTAADVAAARDADELFERCVNATATAGVRDEIEALMALSDPGAELEVALTCAACGEEWIEVLDPVRFFWSATVGAARSVSEDVGVLARAYGWSEREVLAMSGRRRELYLEALNR